MSDYHRTRAPTRGTGPGDRRGRAGKTVKKLLCLLLALTLCMSLCSVGVFADDRMCAVYITESSYGEQYRVYRIFDLTYSSGEERDDLGNMLWDNVAYTLPADSPWYEIVSEGYNSSDLDEEGSGRALSWHESPFVLKQNVTGSYNVSMKETLSTGVPADSAYITNFFRYLTADILERCGITPLLFDENGNVSSDGSLPTANTRGRVEFTVPNGYYFVIGTLGTQVFAFSATSTGYVIAEKNPIPELDKEVWDEASGQWVTRENIKPGDELMFEILIYNAYHQSHLILHDEMSSGLQLEYDPDMDVDTDLGEAFHHTLEVYLGTYTTEEDENGNLIQVPDYESFQHVSGAYYHVFVTEEEYENADTEGQDEGLDDYGRDAFQISFSDDFLEMIEENSVIQVVYYAVVTDDVFIEGGEDDEVNEAFVTYGAFGSTIPIDTDQVDFSFDIRKVDEADWSDAAQDYLYSLDGAVFRLCSVEMISEDLQDVTKSIYEIGDPLQFVWQEAGEHVHEEIDADGNKTETTVVTEQGYRRASEQETEDGKSTADLCIKDGECGIYALTEGWYYLEEIEAPEGYVPLDEGFLIWIGEVREDGFHERVYVNGEQLPDDDETLTIGNYSEDILVETGGIGTGWFYAAGVLLMAGALVLLLQKRRTAKGGPRQHP